MRKVIFSLITLALLLTFSLVNIPQADAASRVRGYTKKNGTYVAPYMRSTPNKLKFDNFSTKGNINPYTGKKGTVNPFKITPKRYKF